MKPLVSISCITFNHKPYIRECLDGFLIQETSFDFEVLIHDDASTDGTIEIIKEYEAKYPDIIKPLIQKENQHSLGLRSINATFNYPRAKGKYIALCEGDDYWTDPLKLQKQINFLENNLNCSMVFHLANCIDMNEEIIGIHGPKLNQEHGQFNIKDAVLNASTLVPTNAMLFHKRYIKNLPSWVLQAPLGDIPLLLLLAHNGDIGFINKTMSAYRVMTPFSWSKKMKSNKKMRQEHFSKIQKMWHEFNEWSNYKYNELLLKRSKKNKFIFMQNEFKFNFPFAYSFVKNLKVKFSS